MLDSLVLVVLTHIGKMKTAAEEIGVMRERQRLTTVWIKDTLGPQLEKVRIHIFTGTDKFLCAGERVDRHVRGGAAT